MTAALRVTWTLEGPGWAGCSVEDHRGRVDLVASDITEAPEDLLNAVARIVAGATESRAQFEAEPTAYRWIFYREGEDVWIRILELREGGHHDAKGTEVWSGSSDIDSLACAVVRCFDEVALTYGVSGYRGKWGEHFPSTELEALRGIWHSRRSSDGVRG